MTSPTVLPPSTETRQQTFLQQLLEHQLALKQLLDQQPEAAKVLAHLLDAQLQQAFRDPPAPITLEMVSCEESIKLTSESGAEAIFPSNAPPRPLAELLKNTPWGGENFQAPHRLYRYYANTRYRVADPSAPGKMRTIHGTLGSTPGFEAFMQDLIHRPDRLFQQQLDSFWRAALTSGKPTTRRQWLADRLAKALVAEAGLRVEDGTLDESSKILIGQIASHPASPARAHLPRHQRPAAFTLSFKGQDNEPDIPLIGVFMLSSKTPDTDTQADSDVGAVALFTPDRGIDAFASLGALDGALRTGLAQPDAGEALLSAIAWQDQPRARRYCTKSPAFTYTPVHENLFENRVDALLAVQKQDIEHGWRRLSRYEADGEQIHELFNRLANIGPFLDIREVLVQRSRRYLEAHLPSWYQEAGEEDKQSLQQRIEAELLANKTLADLARKASLPPLPVFASDELIRQLAIDYPGQGIDPDNVQVTITTSLNPASVGGGIGPDQVPSDIHSTVRPVRTLTLSLTELALKNSDPWDFSFYQVFTGEKTSLFASGNARSGALVQFDERYLTSVIQKLDVGKGYDRLLQKQLIDNGAALRNAWIAAHRTSLATQALAARLDTGSFLEDREQRGYRWVEAVIDGQTPASRRTVGGHRIGASALLIASSAGTRNGYTVNDVLMISAHNPRSLPNVILYTPAAPTGQSLKEFPDSAAMQQFLKQQWSTSPEWRRYFMQRLATPGQAALSESKVARTLLLSELVLGARSRVGNPFDNLRTVAIESALHDALYEQQVVTLRRNADHQSTSNAEVEQQSLWNILGFGLDLASNLIGFLPFASAFNAARSVTRTFLLLKQVDASKSAARALWSITGAKGRLLLPPKRTVVPALRATADLTGLEVAVEPLALDRIKGNLFQGKTSAQQYVLINGKYYLCDVAQRQRFLYPQGTGNKTLRYPLVLDESLENWQAEPMLRLSGGMDIIEKGPLQTTYLDYELPLADRAALPMLNWAGPGSLNLGTLHPALPYPQSTGVLHLFAIQTRLRRHARSYFKTFTAAPRTITLPGRTLLPEDLLQALFSQRNGLVVGEQHVVALAREFSLRNVAVLHRQGVRALYLEGFHTDLHQALLDHYNASPTRPLPALLKERLQIIDIAHQAADPFSYTRLVEAAHAKGIRVMALDSTASAFYAPRDLIPANLVPSLSDQLDRVTLFNFFACKKIAFDQLAQGAHRWMALVGQGHCNTLQSIPGLVELTQATGLRLESRIATHHTLRVKSDPGIVIGSPLGTHVFTQRCDLLACLPGTINQHEIPMRVHSPLLFTTTSAPSGAVGLHYMNARRQTLDVPVLLEGTRAYVDHPAFGAVSNRHFDDLDALTDALMDELGMIEV